MCVPPKFDVEFDKASEIMRVQEIALVHFYLNFNTLPDFLIHFNSSQFLPQFN